MLIHGFIIKFLCHCFADVLSMALLPMSPHLTQTELARVLAYSTMVQDPSVEGLEQRVLLKSSKSKNV